MFGSHLSIAGGMVNALHQAQQLKMDCVQVFTKNQRQWKAKPLSLQEKADWLTHLRRMKWDSVSSGGPARVVSHNSYLINMASPDPDLWRKSLEAQRDELERCEQLHIPLCVAHPGAHLSGERKPHQLNDLCSPPSKPEREGLRRIIKALNAIHRDLPGYRTLTCLETTVGSGTNLGYCFNQLAYIRERVKHPERITFCFDTCHVTAAGYDMSTEPAVGRVLEEFDAICGLGQIRAFHFNDSVGALGSRRDRHAHIGEGCCGRACFRTIVNHPAFRTVPKLLETPKGVDNEGRDLDTVNLQRLKRMTKRPDSADNSLPPRQVRRSKATPATGCDDLVTL